MPLQKMPLKINGTDFSAMTERCGYSIVYEDRKGGNTVVMMNGNEYQDVIVRKPILTWRLDSLTSDQLQQLHAAINEAVYVWVTYFDTAAKAQKSDFFHCTISEQEVGVIRAGGYYRFKAPTLTMRAR